MLKASDKIKKMKEKKHKKHHSHGGHRRKSSGSTEEIPEEANSVKMDSKMLEKRLSSVRDSAEDIQLLSKWCIQHRTHHHSIIQAWSRSVRKCKLNLLVYLLNLIYILQIFFITFLIDFLK